MGTQQCAISDKENQLCSRQEIILKPNEIVISETYCTPKGKYSKESTKFLSSEEKTLFYFCKGSNLVALRFLNLKQVSINTLDEERLSPLHIACRKGSSQIVQELLDMGANCSIPDIQGWTPLHVACYYEREDVIMMLISKGSSLQTKDRDKVRPIDLLKEPSLRKRIEDFALVHSQSTKPQYSTNIRIRINHSKKKNLSFSLENTKKQDRTINTLQALLQRYKTIPKKNSSNLNDDSISIDYDCSFIEELIENEQKDNKNESFELKNNTNTLFFELNSNDESFSNQNKI